MNIKTTENYPRVRIRIDQIAEKPGKFCMSYGFDNTELKRSLLQVGLINPPYIYRSNGDKIEIVTGYRRILALKELNIKEVECVDLSHSNMSEYDLLMFALIDNQFTRKLNPVEKSMIYNSLSNIVKKKILIEYFNAPLDISRKHHELFLKIEKFDTPLKESIAREVINIKALELLIELENDDLLICNEWINKLKLNYNQQIQFIDYIKDIARIEGVAIRNLLNEEYYSNLLQDEIKNTPQKAKQLIENLRERRNPNYTRYSDLFEKRVSKMQLPSNVKIKHSRYFESEGFQLEIEFTDGNDLKKSLKTLLDKEGLENIEYPWVNEEL